MKKIIITVLVLIVLAVAAFFYFTRPVAMPTAGEEAAVAEAGQLATPTSTTSTLYRISSGDATVGFKISEVLHGEPFSPVGTTSQVTGDIIVSNASGTPSATVGTITIDARTLHTDSAQRDGAINRFILKTGTAGNEYITFKPTAITGLPATVVQGTPFSFSVTGDLTVSGVTKSETLAVTATQNADSISGTISGALKRSDFNLTIPNIPFVANVTDDLTISGTFTAHKVN